MTLALTLAFEPPEGDLMRRPPRPPGEPLVTGYMLWRIGYVSLLLVGATLGLYRWEIGQGASVELARTAAVNALVAGEGVYLINSRFFLAPSLSLRAWFGNRYAVLAIGILIGLQLVFTYAPFLQKAFGARGLSGEAWLRIVGAALAIFLAVELEKTLVRGWGTARPVAIPMCGSTRAVGTLAVLLGLTVGGQWLVTVWRVCEMFANGNTVTTLGLVFAGIAVALAGALLLDALATVWERGAATTALNLLAAAALLGSAWHAPAYPFEPEQLPWLLVSATALLALGAVVLALSFTLRRERP
ncbi:cation transporting ATPase C-terminal domain-containing protein [Candidatus Methylocalor cossyra]|uniref:cation transporting ATPase C-terminal domain-containing protein n=1 Tax=Candidatus Methylocalor cossyra TaxID=3108543 RepID=UPI0032B30F06